MIADRHVNAGFVLCIHSIQSIANYLDQQFESYLQEEMKIERNLLDYHDTRVHACLYFIYPTGHLWVQ